MCFSFNSACISFVSGLLCLMLAACKPSGPPSIKFTQVPFAGPGGPNRMETISGIVNGARSNQRIVLFSKAGVWWVQPFTEKPFTTIGRDGKWTASIHMGTDYAALLVDEGYQPAPRADPLPGIGGGIVAAATVAGRVDPAAPIPPPPKVISFSGYDWGVFAWQNDRLGSEHRYNAKNVSVDARGFLHLRISGSPAQWTCSQLGLTRSLGYGTYEFTVQSPAPYELAAVLSMYTWSDFPEQNHREMDVNLTHWGDPESKNAEFVVQPYYLPKNVFRFNAPSGTSTYSFHWEPGGVSFDVVPGSVKTRNKPPMASHTFNMGVPTPEHENVFMNFCEFKYAHVPLQHEAETIIERFQYLP